MLAALVDDGFSLNDHCHTLDRLSLFQSLYHKMYATLVPFVTLACLVFYFLFLPIYQYFRDEKGLRKYPSVNWLAGITNIGFMYEAFKGRRSKTLAELHKEHPVIRIGPNSLSFKSVQAIKVSLLF